MELSNNNWCDSNYIKPISKYEFVLRKKPYFSKNLQQALLKNNIYLATIIYKDPGEDFGIFDCLADFLTEEVIEQLRNRQALFVFDLSFEANLEHFPIDRAVHNSIVKYKLPADSICVLVGSGGPPRSGYSNVAFLYDPSLIIFSIKHNPDLFLHRYSRARRLNFKHHGYYFSAMSCKYRYWRSWALYHLLHSDCAQRAMLTHLHPPNNNELADLGDYLSQHSPILAEQEPNPLDDPSIVMQARVSAPLHVNVLFHLAMETYQDADTVFYTEKTFKSLIAETPTLIWGTPGMNTVDFEKWGFIPYRDWFDLSFDQEPDHDKRWQLLQQEIERVCGMLDSMTVEQRLEWSLQRPDIVKHNKHHLRTLINDHCEEFYQMITAYFGKEDTQAAQ